MQHKQIIDFHLNQPDNQKKQPKGQWVLIHKNFLVNVQTC